MRTEGLDGALLATLVIVVLMITSMAFVISTTPVNAPSTISASPGAILSPTSAWANTSTEFTVTVTNDYMSDNIDNVILIASGFTQPTDLEPTTWNLSEITDGARFDAIGDNVITPGSSKTFVFLWTTPNIAGDYMISVLVSKGEVIYTSYENLGGFIVTIEGIQVLTPRAPIYIGGDAGFTPANGVVAGSGTTGDPYIIENWDINASSAHGIWIRNTTAHFIIRNCYVHDGWVNYIRGIYFNTSVINGKIDNNRVENNYCGIYLDYGSDNNLVTNNLAENNYHGIVLGSSDNNFISNNLVANNTDDGIYLSGSDNNLISNNLVANNRYRGIYLSGSDNNLISNNLVANNRSCGIYLDYGSDNNLVTNNLVENNGYGGIYIYRSDNNLVTNNLAENNECGIYIYRSDNNLVTNNLVENNSYGIWLGSSDNNLISNNLVANNTDGIYLNGSSDNNFISNNLVANNTDDGIYLSGSDNNFISNNLVANNRSLGIYLRGSSNNTLRGNVFRNNAFGFQIYGEVLDHYRQDIDNSNTIDGKPIYYLIGESNLVFDGSFEVGFLGLVESENIRAENLQTFGILLAATSNSTVANSTVTRAGRGIHLFQSRNNLVTNNLVENNYYGIYLYYSDNNLISNNLVENNYYGIYLYYGSDNNLISNNLVENNYHFGIYLIRSNNNFVENNIVENNNYGIRLDSSDNNLISNNLVENNYYGIELYYSDNNLVYHNNIINNATQASDSGSNYWDDGYPSGGNYWSDYTGEDNYRGENQDIPESDKIGDTPYYIPGDNNRDRYPLMNPWLPVIPATIDINPNTLNLKSRGKWITCIIELPEGYDVADIDIGSIRLNGVVPAEPKPTGIGGKKLIAKFSKPAVQAIVDIGEIELAVTGLVNSTPFEGNDTIRVIKPGKADLEIRFMEIPLEWALAPLEEKVALEAEFSDIPLYWALAPS